MAVNEQQVIRRGCPVKCHPCYDGDKGVEEAVITYVHEDKQHVDFRYGFLELLSRERVPIKFIEVL